MASRREKIDPHTTVNISDAIVIQNINDVPVFWSNDAITDTNKGNLLDSRDTIGLATAGAYIRNDTCFDDVYVQIETTRP